VFLVYTNPLAKYPLTVREAQSEQVVASGHKSTSGNLVTPDSVRGGVRPE
jgi:hypothetical protein